MRFRETARRLVALFGPGERAVLEIADRQEGLVSLEQARAGGISRKIVAARIRKGSWRRVHGRVFGVGRGELPARARILAAVLACSSPGAIASHLSAGWLWGMLDRRPEAVHLIALGARNPGRLEGVWIHRPRRPPERIRWRDGIPLTSPIDTLLDLAAVLDTGELEAAVAKAIRARLMTRSELRVAIAAAGPTKGIADLRAAASDPQLTRSGNERALVSLLRAAELTGFETNVIVEGKEVDVYWPEAKLVVEADAYATHGGPAAYEDDHVLDADFEAAGIAVLRFTGRRIRTRPNAVVARVAASLALRSGGLPVPRRRR